MLSVRPQGDIKWQALPAVMYVWLCFIEMPWNWAVGLRTEKTSMGGQRKQAGVKRGKSRAVCEVA